MADRAHTLVVLAKAPVPGRVKTRLQTRFSPAEAASLAAASLADSLDAVRAAGARHRILALDGVTGPVSGFELARQPGGGLDVRLEAAFAAAFRAAPGPVLLIGMDTPQVTPELLDLDWQGADAVLGPAEDGGFWAVGLRRPGPGAFLGVAMSTDRTGRDQHRRLLERGLRVRLLPTLRDVDTPADADAVAALAPGTRFARAHRRLLIGAHRAVQLYETALAGGEVFVEGDGDRRRLDVTRWVADPDAADRLLLSRCEPPVLDVGCGPGRLVGAVAASGRAALGVDISAGAVALTAARGAGVLRRAVEQPLPGEGRWGTLLLVDGNVGIGGDPHALLRRCVSLLRPGGLLLVEADADDQVDGRPRLRLVDGVGRAASLPWARLGAAALLRTAAAAGLRPVEEWRAAGRVFLALRTAAA